MIIDNHTHTWPYYGEEEEWEYKNIDEHMKYSQRHFFTWRLPVRRVKDDSLAKDGWRTLWNENLRGTWEARYDVGFRFEKGRFLWEKDGEEYYSPARSPAPPELLISLMDSVGVDKAVLQHTTNTFKLAKYYSRAVHKYPERFIGLTQIDASEAYTRQEETIEELHTHIEDLGLRGLFWCSDAPPGWDGYDNFHTGKYDPFWRKVHSLNIPVYASFDIWDHRDHLILKIKKWIERFPEITRVLLHGIPPEILLKNENTLQISDIAIDIVKNHDVYLELLPIPDQFYLSLAKGDQVIRCLYETFGPSKLVWGSELPIFASEYNKVLGYFEEKCDYIPEDDLKLILGGNVRKIFGI